MPDQKPYWYLNALLARGDFSNSEFRGFLSEDARVTEVAVDAQYGLDGVLYVKNTLEQRPRWAEVIDSIAGRQVDELFNKSSSAVLLIRIDGNVLAFTFGYGRFLLNTWCFEQDFGLKTALNTLDHQSLRSIDLHTLEDQPIQKKTQVARGSEASVFGVDIFRDVLRAVTGSPRHGVVYKNISGGDAIYSFGLNMLVEEIPKIAADLLRYYQMELYTASFGWVDNIRRVKNAETISMLDASLLKALKDSDHSLAITVPEIVEWDSVLGFSFTRSKRELSPTIDANKYLGNLDVDSVTIESIRRDRLYVTDIHENIFSYSIYSCIYFEIDFGDTKQVLFGGKWYEIDKLFMRGIEATLALIGLSDIRFPNVQTWEEYNQSKIETEGNYNERAAEQLGFYLLDKKLVKSSKTTSSIELCDLLTSAKQFIHVKHRKGGSAGLSHLFAQGSVSAEIMLGDREFRKAARRILRSVDPRASDLVPIDELKSADYEIVFLILGDADACVKTNLPFFSKVNLTRVFENLSQRGFKVSIAGAEIAVRDGT